MSDISYIMANFMRAFAENPAGLVPVLAYACAITFFIALVNDSLNRRRSTAPHDSAVPQDISNQKPN